MLGDIQRLGITDIVNLGDCVSGPLEAAKTADRLIPLNLPTVRGNHDRYLMETPPAALGASDAHAHAQLLPHHLDWLRGLPLAMTYREEVFLCHATPGRDDRYWLEQVSVEGHVHLRPQEDIEALAVGVEQPLILCGHSHVPRVVALSHGRLVVNPGSVGCPPMRTTGLIRIKWRQGTVWQPMLSLRKRMGAGNHTSATSATIT